MKTKKITKSILAISVSLLLCLSCKEKDIVPEAHPNAKVVNIWMTTLNKGTSDSASVTDSVTITHEIVKIRLNVIGASNAKYLYIVHASDSGSFTPLAIPTTNNSFGTFTGGSTSTYSLLLPQPSTFTLELPVGLRKANAALTETYKIWITSTQGAYTLPAQGRVLGMATVTLIYKNGKPATTFSKASAFLGSQSSGNYGSFLTTSAILGTLSENNYLSSPASADMRMVTLTGNQKDNNSTTVWLYSPADVAAANPAVNGQDNFAAAPSSKTTYFASYAGGSAGFDAANTASLEALAIGTANKIKIVSDSVYAFQTQEGKKGLIKINALAPANSVVGTGSTAGRNAYVTVKVLN